MEALRFTVQQYLRMRGFARTDHFLPAPQQQAPLKNQANQVPQLNALRPVPNAQQVPLRPVVYRQQPPRACYNCGDRSHFVADCPFKDRARKPVQGQVNSNRTNLASEWTCPTDPQGMNNHFSPVAVPVQGTVAFCNNCGRTGQAASECMVPESLKAEEQMRTAWYAPAYFSQKSPTQMTKSE